MLSYQPQYMTTASYHSQSCDSVSVIVITTTTELLAHSLTRQSWTTALNECVMSNKYCTASKLGETGAADVEVVLVTE